jgi:hypothetical protein
MAILLFLAGCTPKRSLRFPPSPRRYASDCEELGRGVIVITEYAEFDTFVRKDTCDIWYLCGRIYEVWKGAGFPKRYELPRFHIQGAE